MHDPDTDRTAKIELILSMANMLICGEEEAQAGLNKFQEQWANDQLDLPGLRKFMGELHREEVIARDMLKDITTLIDQAIVQGQHGETTIELQRSAKKSLFTGGRQEDFMIIDGLFGATSKTLTPESSGSHAPLNP